MKIAILAVRLLLTAACFFYMIETRHVDWTVVVGFAGTMINVELLLRMHAWLQERVGFLEDDLIKREDPNSNIARMRRWATPFLTQGYRVHELQLVYSPDGTLIALGLGYNKQPSGHVLRWRRAWRKLFPYRVVGATIGGGGNA